MKKFVILLFFFSLTALTIGCGDDDGGGSNNAPDGCTASFNTDLQTELTAINNATATWSNEPNEANCNALKDAYNDYLDALEEWEDCAEFYNQVTSWQEAIDATRVTINSIC